MAHIIVERIFRCRIDYEGRDTDTEERLTERIFKIERQDKYKALVFDSTRGGAAWNSYVIVEGESESLVKQAAQAIVSTVLSYKGNRILE